MLTYLKPNTDTIIAIIIITKLMTNITSGENTVKIKKYIFNNKKQHVSVAYIK